MVIRGSFYLTISGVAAQEPSFASFNGLGTTIPPLHIVGVKTPTRNARPSPRLAEIRSEGYAAIARND